MTASLTILKINASARKSDSVTRDLAEQVVADLAQANDVRTIDRDVSIGLPVIDETWVAANFTAPAERTPAQRETLALSDSLVAELKSADVVVIGVPIYNFGVPASLKAWVDLVARARETFRYTETGPVGLLDAARDRGFVPRDEGYADKCQLCFHLRRHLHRAGAFVAALAPAAVYAAAGGNERTVADEVE